MEFSIPLKEKYLVFKPPGHKSKSSNSGQTNNKKKGTKLRPRRRAYGPVWHGAQD